MIAALYIILDIVFADWRLDGIEKEIPQQLQILPSKIVISDLPNPNHQAPAKKTPSFFSPPIDYKNLTSPLPPALSSLQSTRTKLDTTYRPVVFDSERRVFAFAERNPTGSTEAGRRILNCRWFCQEGFGIGGGYIL
jgi:hypothetical protein